MLTNTHSFIHVEYRSLDLKFFFGCLGFAVVLLVLQSGVFRYKAPDFANIHGGHVVITGTSVVISHTNLRGKKSFIL